MFPKTKMVGIKKMCYRICKFAIYVGCILGFWFNTVAIFHDWWEDTTMVSTKVVKAPDNSLETPIVLICNTSAYKNPVLEINTDSYKNNTMSFRDALIDVLIANNSLEGDVSELQPISIKEYSTKDIITVIHGTCLIIDPKTKVNPSSIKLYTFVT